MGLQCLIVDPPLLSQLTVYRPYLRSLGGSAEVDTDAAHAKKAASNVAAALQRRVDSEEVCVCTASRGITVFQCSIMLDSY